MVSPPTPDPRPLKGFRVPPTAHPTGIPLHKNRCGGHLGRRTGLNFRESRVRPGFLGARLPPRAAGWNKV